VQHGDLEVGARLALTLPCRMPRRANHAEHGRVGGMVVANESLPMNVKV